MNGDIDGNMSVGLQFGEFTDPLSNSLLYLSEPSFIHSAHLLGELISELLSPSWTHKDSNQCPILDEYGWDSQCPLEQKQCVDSKLLLEGESWWLMTHSEALRLYPGKSILLFNPWEKPGSQNLNLITAIAQPICVRSHSRWRADIPRICFELQGHCH